MNFKEALIAHLQGERVEAMGVEGEWKPLMQKIGEGHFRYIDHNIYMDLSFRLAPRTITVNGVEVPAPEKEVPNHGDEVFYADPCNKDFYYPITWYGLERNYVALNHNLIYLNKDDAIARAKAMLIYKEV